MKNFRTLFNLTILLILISCGNDDTGETIPFIELGMSQATYTSITITGNVIENGNQVNSRGTTWGMESEPTILDNVQYADSNQFELNINNLEASQVYYFRNFVGENQVQYSAQRKFATRIFDHTIWKINLMHDENVYQYDIFFQSFGHVIVYQVDSQIIEYEGNWQRQGNIVNFTINNYNGSDANFVGELDHNSLNGEFSSNDSNGSFSALSY